MSNQRVNDINLRIYQRNTPTIQPQMLIDHRPTPTKYGHLQIVDQRNEGETPIIQRPLYDVNSHFLPGDKGPITTFINNVDQESILRNQFFATQKCDKAHYIPNSNSDLYFVPVVGRSEPNTHNLLFKNYVKNCKSRTVEPSLKDDTLFNNHTRQKVIGS